MKKRDTVALAVGHLMQAEAIMVRIAKGMPEEDGSLVGLPSPRDVLVDSIDRIEQIIDDLDDYPMD